MKDFELRYRIKISVRGGSLEREREKILQIRRFKAGLAHDIYPQPGSWSKWEDVPTIEGENK